MALLHHRHSWWRKTSVLLLQHQPVSNNFKDAKQLECPFGLVRTLASCLKRAPYCTYKATYFHKNDGWKMGFAEKRRWGGSVFSCPQLRGVAKEILTGLGTSARDLTAFQ